MITSRHEYVQFGSRQLGTLLASSLALEVLSGCGATVDTERSQKEIEVGRISQPLVWSPSSTLMQEHDNWHNGGRSPTNRGADFLTFHRNFTEKLKKEFLAGGGDPFYVRAWLGVPSQLKTSALNWTTALANAETRIATNNPPFASEDELGSFIESTVHTWIHGAAATYYNEPVLGTFDSPSSTYFFQIHGMVDTWWSRWLGKKLLHVASSSNISGNVTTLDHPLLNGRPFARLLVTQNWRTNGPYNNHNVGVWYNASISRWTIFNEDTAAMPNGAAFNVQVEGGLSTEITYNVNKAYNYTWFFDSDLSTSAALMVWATHAYNTPVTAFNYDNSPLGVWYTGSVSSIFHENSNLTMTNDLAFFANRYAIWDTSRSDRTFVHTSTSSNTFGNTTYLSNSFVDGHPNAMLIVTPVYNPGGQGGTYNNHPIGVWYNTTSAQWAVFNQDMAPITGSFNVNIQM